MKREDKLLILAGSFPPRTGGVPQALARLCRHMDPDRFAVVTGDDPGAPEVDKLLPYRVFRYDRRVRRGLFSRSPVAFFAATARYGLFAIRKAREIGATVVLAHNCDLHHVLVCHLLRLVLRLPCAMYFMGEDIPISGHTRKSDRARLPLMDRLDLLITISESSRQRLLALGQGREGIPIICQGVDTDCFTPGEGARLREELGIPSDAPVLLTVGRLDSRKGHEIVIRALASLGTAFPALRYVIVGAGPQEAALRALVQDLHVADQVLFLGFQPDDLLPEYYRMADIFVMPNRTMPGGDTEGFGLVFLEANACGRPVVGGRAGGAVDAIRHEETGLLVQPDDVPALAHALSALLGNPELRQRLGENGRRRALADFSTRGQAQRLWERLMRLPRRSRRDEPAVAEVPRMRSSDEERSGRISVVIPAFNAAATIIPAVEGALSQDLAPGEIIVVDDGSTDDTRETLQPFRDRVRYIFQPNQGIGGARNAGIEAASGELIALLDADDVWTSHHLRRHAELFRRDPELAVVFSRARLMDAQGALLPLRLPDDRIPGLTLEPVPGVENGYRLRGPVLNVLLNSSFLLPSAATIRSDVLRELGMFDWTMMRCEDRDLWYRLASRGYGFGFIDEETIRYRKTRLPAEENLLLLEHPELRVKPMRKLLADPALTDAETRKIAARKIAGMYHASAAFEFACGNTSKGRAHLRQAMSFCLRPVHLLGWLLSWLGTPGRRLATALHGTERLAEIGGAARFHAARPSERTLSDSSKRVRS